MQTSNDAPASAVPSVPIGGSGTNVSAEKGSKINYKGRDYLLRPGQTPEDFFRNFDEYLAQPIDILPEKRKHSGSSSDS